MTKLSYCYIIYKQHNSLSHGILRLFYVYRDGLARFWGFESLLLRHGIRRLSVCYFCDRRYFSAPLSGVQIYFCNAITRHSPFIRPLLFSNGHFSASLSGVRINYLYHITRHSPFIRPLLFSNGHFSASLSGVRINYLYHITRHSPFIRPLLFSNGHFSASLSGVRINYLYHITRHSPFIRPLLFSNGHFFCLATVKSLQAAL